MEKRKIRIGQLAQILDVKQFVIRFWEKEFNFKSRRSDGGQRYYTKNDLNKFKKIRELLYNKGYTIAGAKKHLEDNTNQDNSNIVFAASKTTLQGMNISNKNSQTSLKKINLTHEDFLKKVMLFQKQLIKLRELL